MSRFKRGDKVRVVCYAGNDTGNTRYFSIGDIGVVEFIEVIGIKNPSMIQVNFNDPSNKKIYQKGIWYVYCEDSLEFHGKYDKIDISTLDEDALIPDVLYKQEIK